MYLFLKHDYDIIMWIKIPENYFITEKKNNGAKQIAVQEEEGPWCIEFPLHARKYYDFKNCIHGKILPNTNYIQLDYHSLQCVRTENTMWVSFIDGLQSSTRQTIRIFTPPMYIFKIAYNFPKTNGGLSNMFSIIKPMIITLMGEKLWRCSKFTYYPFYFYFF